jgi:uncharacterized protein
VHLDLKGLERFPAHVSLEEATDNFELIGDGLLSSGPASVDLEIIRSDNIHYCRGRARCRVRLECSRCLEQFDMDLDGEIELSVRELLPKEQIGAAEVPDNELVIEAGRTEVDITDPVREALIIALPFRPLCRESCRGLCPVCGINKNEKSCSCRTGAVDPRWEKLRDLLK